MGPKLPDCQLGYYKRSFGLRLIIGRISCVFALIALSSCAEKRKDLDPRGLVESRREESAESRKLYDARYAQIRFPRNELEDYCLSKKQEVLGMLLNQNPTYTYQNCYFEVEVKCKTHGKLPNSKILKYSIRGVHGQIGLDLHYVAKIPFDSSDFEKISVLEVSEQKFEVKIGKRTTFLLNDENCY